MDLSVVSDRIDTVRAEIEAGQLVELGGKSYPKIPAETFGVWWLRERRGMDIWVAKLSQWLRRQNLS